MALVFLPHDEIAMVACAAPGVVAVTWSPQEYLLGFVFCQPEAEILLVSHPVGDLTWQSLRFDEGSCGLLSRYLTGIRRIYRNKSIL